MELYKTIEIINKDIQYLFDFKLRCFGWVQNPSDISSLEKVLELFIPQSDSYNNMLSNKIPNIVTEEIDKVRLRKALLESNKGIAYNDLVGTGNPDRSIAKCDGLIQALITGQKGKAYIDNWSSEGFIRWGVALGFLVYNYEKDTLVITNEGINFITTTTGSEKYQNLYIAILKYPPIYRILYLLEQNEHMTKYEIAQNLGFVGEEGFSSLNQNDVLLELLNSSGDKKNKIRRNRESTNDKYARTLCSWLKNIYLVVQKEKYFYITDNNREFVSHAYMLNPQYSEYIKELLIKVRSKTICWEMLSNVRNHEERYNERTRRSIMLKSLTINRKGLDVYSIRKILENYQLFSTLEEIENDLKNLINVGINIVYKNNIFILEDSINNFVIPWKK